MTKTICCIKLFVGGKETRFPECMGEYNLKKNYIIIDIMCDKKQTISDNEKFVSKGIIELIPDWETNETLKRNLPKILETAKKTKEWCFNFMTGEIYIFDDADVSL